MIVLIFALALAIEARLLHFPATSLPDPAAGKGFSLPTRLGNALQKLDSTGDFRSERADFGAETKNFPAVSLSAGKAAAAECRFPISFHSTGSKALRAPDTPEMEKQYFTQWRPVRSALFQLDTMEVLVSLLASGACEKSPRLQLRTRRVGGDLAALRIRPPRHRIRGSCEKPQLQAQAERLFSAARATSPISRTNISIQSSR
jgi:hypothetical protein